MRKPWFTLVILGAITLGGSGCALHRGAPSAPPPCDAQAIVFVADGAGDFQKSSQALLRVVQQDGIPLHVVTFDWSHGYARVVADQTRYGWARAQGERLAREICATRQQHPNACIYLMAHSAGAAVALAAAEVLPPGVANGVVLLSPSVSAGYDVRPALAHLCGPLDVFYSRHDWFMLGVATRVIGTTDRSHEIPAGRVGFRPVITHPEDSALYGRLRQHEWSPQDRQLGHDGGHYGAYQPEYLRARVIPVFFGN